MIPAPRRSLISLLHCRPRSIPTNPLPIKLVNDRCIIAYTLYKPFGDEMGESAGAYWADRPRDIRHKVDQTKFALCRGNDLAGGRKSHVDAEMR